MIHLMYQCTLNSSALHGTYSFIFCLFDSVSVKLLLFSSVLGIVAPLINRAKSAKQSMIWKRNQLFIIEFNLSLFYFIASFLPERLFRLGQLAGSIFDVAHTDGHLSNET